MDLYTNDELLEMQDKADRFEKSREWFDELVEAVYFAGSVNRVDNALDELSSLYETKLPGGDPRIKGRWGDVMDIEDYVKKART